MHSQFPVSLSLPAMADDSVRGYLCSGLGPWTGAVLTRVGWVVLNEEQGILKLGELLETRKIVQVLGPVQREIASFFFFFFFNQIK